MTDDYKLEVYGDDGSLQIDAFNSLFGVYAIYDINCWEDIPVPSDAIVFMRPITASPYISYGFTQKHAAGGNDVVSITAYQVGADPANPITSGALANFQPFGIEAPVKYEPAFRRKDVKVSICVARPMSTQLATTAAYGLVVRTADKTIAYAATGRVLDVLGVSMPNDAGNWQQVTRSIEEGETRWWRILGTGFAGNSVYDADAAFATQGGGLITVTNLYFKTAIFASLSTLTLGVAMVRAPTFMMGRMETEMAYTASLDDIKLNIAENIIKDRGTVAELQLTSIVEAVTLRGPTDPPIAPTLVAASVKKGHSIVAFSASAGIADFRAADCIRATINGEVFIAATNELIQVKLQPGGTAIGTMVAINPLGESAATPVSIQALQPVKPMAPWITAHSITDVKAILLLPTVDMYTANCATSYTLRVYKDLALLEEVSADVAENAITFSGLESGSEYKAVAFWSNTAGDGPLSSEFYFTTKDII
jgi:hypothetical protein